MKNRFIKSILYSTSIAFILAFSSCSEEFLEIDPFQSVSLDGAIQTLDDYKAAVNGIYDQMQSSNYYGRYFILVPDVMSDDVKQNAQANRARDFSDYVANSLDGIANGMFNDIYTAINRANVIINADPEIPAAIEDDVNQLIGQAYALRGLAYFDAVRAFGQHYGFTSDNSHPGVPIVLEFDQNNRPARNTVAEVYAQVLSDLGEGIKLMQQSSTDKGRMTKEAAQAILARVHLYMGNWAQAEQNATDVINSTRFTLVGTDEYAASWEDGFSSESILSIVFRQDDDNGADALGRMYLVDGYGDYLPSQDVIDLIPEGDARLGVFKADPNLSGDLGSVRVNKYPNPAVQNNTPIVRLSEMYLIRAEARAMQNNEAGAQADVTVIRQRGLPTAAAVTASGDALLDEIENERRIELMFEGHRLWDLMRKKKGVFRTNCTNLICEIPYPNPRFILPIPQREIDANANMSQNPDY